jgi:hypothetical protein
MNEWGEGTALYRQEFSGKILAIHNRHGDLWDGPAMVFGNGSAFTQGDRYMGGVILADVEAGTADYNSMAGQCRGTNVPYRSCQGSDFSGMGRGELGTDLRPSFVWMGGAGDLLWIGGEATLRNGSGGIYTGYARQFVDVAGFNDAATISGVGGTWQAPRTSSLLRTSYTPSPFMGTGEPRSRSGSSTASSPTWGTGRRSSASILAGIPSVPRTHRS